MEKSEPPGKQTRLFDVKQFAEKISTKFGFQSCDKFLLPTLFLIVNFLYSGMRARSIFLPPDDDVDDHYSLFGKRILVYARLVS